MVRNSQEAPGDLDFLRLIKVLWRQKAVILLSFVVCVVFALLIAFVIVAPSYKVSSTVRQPSAYTLEPLTSSGLYMITPEAALKRVIASLESYSTRRAFFSENAELFKDFMRQGESVERAFERFNREALSVKSPDFKILMPSSGVAIAFDYKPPVDGANILNRFVKYAMDNETQRLKSDVEAVVEGRIGDLQAKLHAEKLAYNLERDSTIASLRENNELKKMQLKDELKALRYQLKLQREARIQQLSESIAIAKSLHIIKPATPSSMAEAGAGGGANVVRTEINNQSIPLYFMGVEALSAERLELQKRTNDDFVDFRIAQIAKELQLLENNRQVQVLIGRSNDDLFVRNTEDLKKELDRLSKLSIDFDRVSLAAVDQVAHEENSVATSVRVFIVLLGGLLGGLVGVALALMRNYVHRVRYSLPIESVSDPVTLQDVGKRVIAKETS